MKRIFSLSTTCVVLLMALSSCNGTWFNVPDIIPPIPSTTVITVPSFDEIEVNAPVHLHLTQANTQKIEVLADSFWTARLDVQVSGNVLSVNFLPDSSNNQPDSIPQYDVDVFVEIPNLTRVQTRTATKIEGTNRFNLTDVLFKLRGASDVSFEADAATFELDVAGASQLVLDVDVDTLYTRMGLAGRMEAMGDADVHELKIRGASEVESFDLLTNSTSVNIIGAGNCEVNAQNDLDVSITGAGIVYYKGNPTITQNINGLGQVVDSN